MYMYNKHFGLKLAKALGKAGLKQFQFAEKMGVKASTISRWINGHDFPEEDRIDLICSILNVDNTYFIPDGDKPTLTEEQLLKTIEAYQKETKLLRDQIRNSPTELQVIAVKAKLRSVVAELESLKKTISQIPQDILKGIEKLVDRPNVMNNLRSYLGIDIKSGRQKSR